VSGRVIARQLPDWSGRAAALGLAVAAVGAIYLLAVAPLVGAYRSTDGAVAQAGRMLVRYSEIASRRAALAAQLDELVARQAASGVYLSGETDALAGAALQEGVGATIEAHGGKLRSIQILPVSDDGDFKRVSVRVQLTAALVPLQRILHGLESGRPFVFIDNLEIKTRRARRSRRSRRAKAAKAATAAPTTDPTLEVRFDLYGYLRPELG
jgi:general secretion pathway protein M